MNYWEEVKCEREARLEEVGHCRRGFDGHIMPLTPSWNPLPSRPLGCLEMKSSPAIHLLQDALPCQMLCLITNSGPSQLQPWSLLTNHKSSLLWSGFSQVFSHSDENLMYMGCTYPPFISESVRYLHFYHLVKAFKIMEHKQPPRLFCNTILYG